VDGHDRAFGQPTARQQRCQRVKHGKGGVIRLFVQPSRDSLGWREQTASSRQ